MTRSNSTEIKLHNYSQTYNSCISYNRINEIQKSV